MQFDPQQYYLSHKKLPLIGDKGQQQLQQSKVLVIGTGGLGCPCLQYLAGCGIGNIGIADYDTVSISNLHRQVLFSMNDVGKLKNVIAGERLSMYNPGIKIQTHTILVDETNVISLISEYDVVVDCTDNFQVRYLINDACIVLDKPLVYGAIHQTEGHVTVFNYHHSPTLRCLFPEEDNAVIQSCADIGAYNIITGMIGTMMANEVIKVILHHPEVLSGKLCQFDSLELKIRQIKYQPISGSREKSIKRFKKQSFPVEISAQSFLQKIDNKESFYLVDVREPFEHQAFNIGGELMPLQTLLQRSDFAFNKTQTVILYCEMGTRSLQAAKYLQTLGFTSLSLIGGLVAWNK